MKNVFFIKRGSFYLFGNKTFIGSKDVARKFYERADADEHVQHWFLPDEVEIVTETLPEDVSGVFIEDAWARRQRPDA